jgi:hypothetical protein
MTAATVGLTAILLAAAGPAAPAPEFSTSDPPELQFSDARFTDGREDRLGRALAAGSPQRAAAALRLWRGHSRSHARAVVAFAATGPEPFKREVEAGLTPEAVLAEFRTGDYRWGAWLAGLRPHKDFVPVLLSALKDRPDALPETTLALGMSGDRTALAPLLDLLKTGGYRAAGDAAQALGYLGLPEAEPALIEALGGQGWVQVRASTALAKVGTRAALPALKKLAADPGYTGGLNVKGMAQAAVKAIEKRESKK